MPEPEIRTPRATIAIALAACGVGVAVFFAARAFPEALTRWDSRIDFFGSDTARVVLNMTERNSNHHRTEVHTLFSLLVCGPCLLLQRLGMRAGAAVALVLAANAAAFSALLHRLLLSITRRLADASVFWALALSSGSVVVWIRVPETYPFGATAILLALTVAATPALRERLPWHVAAGIAACGTTITNGMASLAAAVAALPVLRAVRAAALVLAAVGLLAGVQKAVFPRAKLLPDPREEVRYLASPAEMPGATRRFFLDSLWPAGAAARPDGEPGTTEVVLARPRTPIGLLATLAAWGAWSALLVVGLGTVWAERRDEPLALALLLFLGGQLLLHLAYGASETFLYSLHWLPSLVLAGAFAARGRGRVPALVVAASLAALALVRNLLLVGGVVDAAVRAMTRA